MSAIEPNEIETLINHASGNQYSVDDYGDDFDVYYDHVNPEIKQRLADLGRIIDAHEKFYQSAMRRRPNKHTLRFVLHAWGPFIRQWQASKNSMSVSVDPYPGQPNMGWIATVHQDQYGRNVPAEYLDQVARYTAKALSSVRSAARGMRVAVPSLTNGAF